MCGVIMHLFESENRNSNGQIFPFSENRFTHHLTLFIPSVNRQGKIPLRIRHEMLDNLRRSFCQTFGGITEWQAMGHWNSSNGMVKERITLIRIYFNGDLQGIMDTVNELCNWMKRILKQDKIALEIDSKFFLI
jgi:hypothetical protein